MHGTRGRRRTGAGLVTAGLALVVALAGCTADGGGDDAASHPMGAGPEQTAPLPGAAGQDQQAGTPPVIAQERAIVYTGSITVRAEKVTEAAAKAISIAVGAGGHVGTDKRSSSGPDAQATLTLRVPAARFATVVEDLAGLGTEEQRGVSTEDVTEAVVDVDARIATQQASVVRTRALLTRARTIAEIVSIEAELAKREAELASLQARKRRLADVTTLSTITVTLLGPGAPEPKEDDPRWGFLAGMAGGWAAVVTAVRALSTVVGALLPALVVFGVPIAALLWLARARLRRRAG